jgi:mevalonate kinase
MTEMRDGIHSAEAPTKIILSGEHSVVYGYPAIVLAVEPKVRAEARLTGDAVVRVSSSHLGVAEYDFVSGGFKGEPRLLPALEVVRSVLETCGCRSGLTAETFGEVPVAAGMGSSASAFVSTALATFRAAGVDPSKGQLFDAAMVGEKMVHGRPSGIDVEIAISGGAMRYVKGGDSRRIGIDADLPLLVINTGLERSTGDMVEKFRSNLESGGEEKRRLLDTMGSITENIEVALGGMDLDIIGHLMTANHCVLSSFGVSVPALDSIVAQSIIAGATGAKLTGAGGGGSAIALARPDLMSKIVDRMDQIGFKSFPAKLSQEGVTEWTS